MSDQPQTRRAFFKTAARITLLGAVGLIGIVLSRRRQDCEARGGCGGCNVVDNCSLPWKVAKR